MLAKYFVLFLSLGLMNIYAKDNKTKKVETPKFEVKYYVRIWDEGKEVYLYLNKIKNSYSPQIFDGEKEPEKLPNIEEDKKSLYGFDLNKNNLRDDIEVYLNRNITDEKLRNMLKYYAREMIKLSKNIYQMSPTDVSIFEKKIFLYFSCMTDYSEKIQNHGGYKQGIEWQMFYNNQVRYNFFRSISDFTIPYSIEPKKDKHNDVCLKNL